MRSNILSTIVTSTLITSMLLSSCGSEKAGTTTTEQPTAAAQTDTTAQTTEAAEDFFSKLPTASSIPTLLEATGVEYNKSLANKSGKGSAYATSADKAALNLGVYGADVAYLCAYNKNKEAQPYISDIQKLAEHLNATDAFGAAMLERFKKNMENNDSLISLTDEGIKVANALFKQSERKADAYLIGVGGFVEGLYLATGLVESFPKDLSAEARTIILVKLTRAIVDQKTPLADLVTIGKSLPADASPANVQKGLEALLTAYQTLNLDEQIKQNKGSLILDDATLKTITAQVKALRTEITK